MARSQLSVVVQQILAACEQDWAGSTDGELLTRFLSQRDDDALAALVDRHAPMVWGVYRRVLRNPHDTEDAFQANFLVLVRKAATVKSRELLANWLYGVAHQTAVRQRATAAKRGTREMQMQAEQKRGHSTLRNGPEITSRFGVVLFFGPTARDPTAQSEGLGRSFAHMICFSA